MSAAYYVCTTKVDFPATEAPGVPGVLRLYYKSRLSSHGSSGCPRRTTSVLQSRLSGHGNSGRPRHTIRLYYKSRLSSYGSSACPRRTTFVLQKIDFPSHGSSGCPRRTAFVLQKSTFQPRNTTVLAPRPCERPQRGYVCMPGNAKTRGFWHRANAETRRGVTFVCQKMQKLHGFGTAPTPKPAEGCLRPRKKVPKTTVLAPRPGDHPQRVVRGHKETQKNDGFGTATTPKPAEGCPRKSRNVKKRRF